MCNMVDVQNTWAGQIDIRVSVSNLDGKGIYSSIENSRREQMMESL